MHPEADMSTPQWCREEMHRTKQTRKSSPRVPVNASLLHGQAAGAFCCCSWLSEALLDSAPLASGSVLTFKIASGAVPVDFSACTQHV